MNDSRASGTALVVGGGVVGLCSALALSKAGYRVRLVEQGRIGRQASWAGGGILCPLYPWKAAAAVWQLAAESLRVYPALCQELLETTGIDPEWTASGMLVLDVEQAEPAQRWAVGAGLPVGQLSVRFGQTEARPALWLPWVAQIRNPQLCKALAQLLRQRGVEVMEGVGEARLAVEAGRVAVLSPQQRWDADVVVAAAGAWNGALLSHIGWPLPVTPVKGQMLMLSGPVGLLDQIVLSADHYLIPRRDGRILVGSTVEPEAGFDASTTQLAHDQLRAFASAIMPSLGQLSVERHWAGLRPGTPEGIPIIAKHPSLKNLFVNAGHHRNGLTLAPASANRLLALLP